ncbi:MAG: universal stress protein [Alphaproteobacteria bacterium]
MYKNVLLPIDLAEASSWRKALPAAVEACQTSGGTLHIMTVVPDYGSPAVAQYFPEDFEERMIAESNRELAALAAKLVPKGVSVETVVVYGGIYEKILETAGAIGADLIVVASHRPELKDYLLGPNAARVVRHANQSVLVVRE